MPQTDDPTSDRIQHSEDSMLSCAGYATPKPTNHYQPPPPQPQDSTLSPEDRITDAWINDLQPLLTRLRATAYMNRPSSAAGGPFTITVSFPTGQTHFYDGGTESQAIANAARFLRSLLSATAHSLPTAVFTPTRSETEQFTTDEPIDDLMTNDLVEEQCRELRDRNEHLERQLTRAIRQRDEARDCVTATETEAQRWRISYEQAIQDRDRIQAELDDANHDRETIRQDLRALYRRNTELQTELERLRDRGHGSQRRPIEKQLIARASPNQPASPTWPSCPKCGSAKKPIVTYQPNTESLTNPSIHFGACAVQTEHLHRICRTCHYGDGRLHHWTAPCLDAPDPSIEEVPA